MADLTKAELVSELEAMKQRWRMATDRFDKLDPEALALAQVVDALKPFDKDSTSYGYGIRQPRTAIARILNAAAARFGVSPDWEAIAQLTRQAQMSQEERVELERLRDFEQMIQSQSHRA